MDEFKEEEIESILYIGREVSGQRPRLQAEVRSRSLSLRSIQDPTLEEERGSPRTRVG